MRKRPLCNSMEDLLAAADVSSIEMLSDYFMDHGLDTEVEVDDRLDGSFELIMRGYGRGAEFRFPVTLEEIWSDLEDIELEYWVPIHIECLEETIEQVENIEVTVQLDEALDDPQLAARIGRRTAPNGELIQELWTLVYPFNEPMADATTVKQWLEQRFEPHCLGCHIDYFGTITDTLGDLRNGNDSTRDPTQPRIPRL